jgi:hypothetical protein
MSLSSETLNNPNKVIYLQYYLHLINLLTNYNKPGLKYNKVNCIEFMDVKITITRHKACTATAQISCPTYFMTLMLKKKVILSL